MSDWPPPPPPICFVGPSNLARHSFTCLKSLPRGSEDCPKDIHCPEPRFQAGNLSHYASTSYSSITYMWALITSQRSVILSHCLGYSSATPTVIWKTYLGYIQTIVPTADEEEQLSFADSLLHKLHFRIFLGNYSTFPGSKMIKPLREIYSRKYQDSVHSVEKEAEWSRSLLDQTSCNFIIAQRDSWFTHNTHA